MTIPQLVSLWQEHFAGDELPGFTFFSKWRRYSADDINESFRITAHWCQKRIDAGEAPTIDHCSRYASTVMRNRASDRLELEMLQRQRESEQ